MSLADLRDAARRCRSVRDYLEGEYERHARRLADLRRQIEAARAADAEAGAALEDATGKAEGEGWG